jgi:hypothetical protein
MNLKLIPAILVPTAAMLASAQANTITGSLWHVPEATSQDAVPANVPASTPDVVFDVNAPFNFSGTSTTVENWLGSSGAFNIVENTPGTLSSLMDNFAQGTFVKFTGFVTVTSGQTFTVTHDDGLTLIIGGTNLNFNPGPTSPITSTATYTGPSGTFPFELEYAECCGGPAVLQLDLPLSNAPGPSPVPEGGATAAILAMGLLGLLGFAKQVRLVDRQ